MREEEEPFMKQHQLHRPSGCAIIGVLVVVSVLGGLSWAYSRIRPTLTDAAPSATRWPLASFSENDVRVEISLEKDAAEQYWLVGTFTPLRAHFHLYSKDLPKSGVLGQGRPTLLEIVNSDAIRSIGPLMADRTTVEHYSQVIEQSLLVYPEGPVNLRMRVALTEGSARQASELSVTYMACSDELCLTPVIGKHISVSLPGL